jgi:hypothetical protein
VQVDLRFRRVPPRSCVVRALLDGEPPIPLNVSYLYGRGEGSTAKEQAWVHVRIDAAAIAARGGQPKGLTLLVEDLDGNPIEEPGFLELVDHELRPM